MVLPLGDALMFLCIKLSIMLLVMYLIFILLVINIFIFMLLDFEPNNSCLICSACYGLIFQEHL